MKVNSAGGNLTYLKQGIHQGDLSGHALVRGSRILKGGADTLEISEEARARFLNGRSVIEKRVDAYEYAGTRTEIHETAELTGTDFIEPARLERVGELKELVVSGRYDFDNGKILKSASEALLAVLLK